MPGMKTVMSLALGAALTIGSTLLAQAASWPNGMVHIIVPFPPGGPTDVVARLISIKLSKEIGQTVIVENKAGADGNLGATYVANAAPDGNTLLFVVPGIITNTFFQKNAVNPITQLQPVIALNRLANVLVVRPDLGVNTVEELEKLAKSKPGAVSCASSGSLPTVGCELFKARTGADIIMVRYKGNGPALAALSSGEVSMLFDVVNTATEASKAGRVKVLATTNNEKMTGFFADLPLLKDKYEGFSLVAFQGLMAPIKTPKDTIVAVNAAVDKVLKDPEIQKAFEAASMLPVGGSPEVFGEMIKGDTEKYSTVVKGAGIQPE